MDLVWTLCAQESVGEIRLTTFVVIEYLLLCDFAQDILDVLVGDQTLGCRCGFEIVDSVEEMNW